VDFLGREQWKFFSQIKPRLRAKHGIRAGAGAVGLELAVFKDMPQQIEVLNHRGGKFNHETHERHEKKFLPYFAPPISVQCSLLQKDLDANYAN
jgi:hypothetical protein